MTGYVICATPRSGSTLLCNLLRASGVAGDPQSWFRAADRQDHARAWGILRGDGGFDPADYLAAALRAGRGGGPVFALRLMQDSLEGLVDSLGGAAPPDQAALLMRHFGPLRFVHLSRPDRIAQAVSRHRAEVSGTWHLGFEEAEHPAPVTYDADRIAHWMKEVAAAEAAWEAWFDASRISPLRVTYADLSADPEACTLRVLQGLGLSLPPGRRLAVPNRRMADQVSAAWVRRFAAERGLDESG